MALYVCDYQDGSVRASHEQSPEVVLVTEADGVEGVPAEVRSAADRLLPGNLDVLRSGQLPAGASGAVIWFEGDRLLEGNGPLLRKNLRVPGRFVLAPTNYPYLEGMDLVTVRPVSVAAGKVQEHWSPNLRIEGGISSDRALAVLRGLGQAWAALALPTMEEARRPGSGLDGLANLWKSEGQLPANLAALALRNLALALLRHREFDAASELLAQGMKRYSSYGDLFFLKALLCVHQKCASKALPYLQQARLFNRGYISGAGESTYRADWLTGVLAVHAGNERLGFQCFTHGMNLQPVFLPAVMEILKLRLPPAYVEHRQFEFCRLARRQPQLVEAVFDFLLQHRAFRAARRLADTLVLADEKRAALVDRWESARKPFTGSPIPAAARPGVMIEGHFLEHSSLARINREIAKGLLDSPAFDASLQPSTYATTPAPTVADGEMVREALRRKVERLDLTIRHQWPPDFSRPSRGKLALILPWEYGSLPRAWVDQIRRNVDELWVPSRFVRDVMERSGVPLERVRVIPNGIDPALFCPEGPTLRPQGARRFVFLFVGGPIRRKGIDLLLTAYREAFDAGEDVTLLVVGLGSNAAYQHNSLMNQVMAAAWDPRAPHVDFMAREVDDSSLAGLYRGCDAFVMPYRAEGFCMPLMEAMACGKPVITTALGPSQDFCSPSTAFLVPARETLVPDALPPFGEMAGDFTWFEPDAPELAQTLRRVYENRVEAARRGAAAARTIYNNYRWPGITRSYRKRVEALLKSAQSAEPPSPAPQLTAGLAVRNLPPRLEAIVHP